MTGSCSGYPVLPRSNLAERLEVAAADILYYKGGKRGMPSPVFFENVSTLLSEAADALREKR